MADVPAVDGSSADYSAAAQELDYLIAEHPGVPLDEFVASGHVSEENLAHFRNASIGPPLTSQFRYAPSPLSPLSQSPVAFHLPSMNQGQDQPENRPTAAELAQLQTTNDRLKAHVNKLDKKMDEWERKCAAQDRVLHWEMDAKKAAQAELQQVRQETAVLHSDNARLRQDLAMASRSQDHNKMMLLGLQTTNQNLIYERNLMIEDLHQEKTLARKLREANSQLIQGHQTVQIVQSELEKSQIECRRLQSENGKLQNDSGTNQVDRLRNENKRLVDENKKLQGGFKGQDGTHPRSEREPNAQLDTSKDRRYDFSEIEGYLRETIYAQKSAQISLLALRSVFPKVELRWKFDQQVKWHTDRIMDILDHKGLADHRGFALTPLRLDSDKSKLIDDILSDLGDPPTHIAFTAEDLMAMEKEKPTVKTWRKKLGDDDEARMRDMEMFEKEDRKKYSRPGVSPGEEHHADLAMEPEHTPHDDNSQSFPNNGTHHSNGSIGINDICESHGLLRDLATRQDKMYHLPEFAKKIDDANQPMFSRNKSVNEQKALKKAGTVSSSNVPDKNALLESLRKAPWPTPFKVLCKRFNMPQDSAAGQNMLIILRQIAKESFSLSGESEFSLKKPADEQQPLEEAESRGPIAKAGSDVAGQNSNGAQISGRDVEYYSVPTSMRTVPVQGKKMRLISP